MNHTHILYDSDPHFRIDPISRNIINESSSKVKLVQHDHNSERFTFETPRYIEGHDLMECNKVEIHYLNIESNTKTMREGVYTVDDLQIKSDDENIVVCSWTITNNATQLVGQLNFLIRFSCVNEDTGALEYAWNTSAYSGISISSGIYNNDSASDNPVPPYNLVTTINGRTVRFFIGTQAEYSEIDGNDANTIYYITDDDALGEVYDAITKLTTDLTNGTVVVSKAATADTANRLIVFNESDNTDLPLLLGNKNAGQSKQIAQNYGCTFNPHTGTLKVPNLSADKIDGETSVANTLSLKYVGHAYNDGVKRVRVGHVNFKLGTLYVVALDGGAIGMFMYQIGGSVSIGRYVLLFELLTNELWLTFCDTATMESTNYTGTINFYELGTLDGGA